MSIMTPPPTVAAPATIRGTTPMPKWLIAAFNPIMRWLLRSRRHQMVSNDLLLLHVTGRRTGRHYDVPVGYHDVDGALVVVTKAPWRENLRGGAACEVTLRGQRRRAHASLVEEADDVAKLYGALLDRYGADDAPRRIGVRVVGDGLPDHAALVAAVERDRLSAVRIDLDEAR